jgi:hypothetical protein
MNIQFNISDDKGPALIAAARWLIPDRLDLTDDKIISKYLKQKIGELIDSHTRYLAVGIDEANFKTIQSQYKQLQYQLMAAENTFRGKLENFEKNKVPTEIQ